MQDQELIDSLGLGSNETSNAGGTEGSTSTEGTETEASTSPAKRTELKIVGTINQGVGLLPALERRGGGGGKTGSKYPFETLAAPTLDEAGAVTGYAFFEVKLTDVENADAKKLQSAIQAAVAAQNKKHKDAGEATKFVSRTLVDDAGAYVGSSVYRVDGTLDAAE